MARPTPLRKPVSIELKLKFGHVPSWIETYPRPSIARMRPARILSICKLDQGLLHGPRARDKIPTQVFNHCLQTIFYLPLTDCDDCTCSTTATDHQAKHLSPPAALKTLLKRLSLNTGQSGLHSNLGCKANFLGMLEPASTALLAAKDQANPKRVSPQGPIRAVQSPGRRPRRSEQSGTNEFAPFSPPRRIPAIM